MKKLLALLLAAAILLTLAACKKEPQETEPISTENQVYIPTEPEDTPSVYYLNHDPDQNAAWQSLAKEYTDATGIPVLVLTAAPSGYSETLNGELNKAEPPTLFFSDGRAPLSDVCYDLSGTAVYEHLSGDSFALKSGDAVVGVAATFESYGILVNTELLARAELSLENISSFEGLKVAAETVTENSENLGFAAFAVPGTEPSERSIPVLLGNRFLPGYTGSDEDLAGLRQLWDLVTANTTASPEEFLNISISHSMQEFAEGKALFCFGGTWDYESLTASLDGNSIALLPLFTGNDSDSICTGSRNYWCVNKGATQCDIDATLDFLNWCVTEKSDYLQQNMGLLLPYSTAMLTNTIAAQAIICESPLPWNSASLPAADWFSSLGDALTIYAANPDDDTWALVCEAF